MKGRSRALVRCSLSTATPSEQVDSAKAALKETGATDISSTSEAGSKDASGGRGTFGNISDSEAIASRTIGEQPVVFREVEEVPVARRSADGQTVVDSDELMTGARLATKY
jgi:hypothetical protein